MCTKETLPTLSCAPAMLPTRLAVHPPCCARPPCCASAVAAQALRRGRRLTSPRRARPVAGGAENRVCTRVANLLAWLRPPRKPHNSRSTRPVTTKLTADSLSDLPAPWNRMDFTNVMQLLQRVYVGVVVIEAVLEPILFSTSKKVAFATCPEEGHL